MQENHHSMRSGASITAATSELLVAVGLLGGMFALLLAASYPVVGATVAAGAVSAVALKTVWTRVTLSGGVRVPGTDVCLRPAP